MRGIGLVLRFYRGHVSWYYGFFLMLAAGLILGLAWLFPKRFALTKRGGRAAMTRLILGLLIVSGLTMYPFIMLLRETSRVELDWRRMVDDWSTMAAKSNPDLFEITAPWQTGHVDEEADFGIRKGVRYPLRFSGYTVLARASGFVRAPARYYALFAAFLSFTWGHT